MTNLSLVPLLKLVEEIKRRCDTVVFIAEQERNDKKRQRYYSIQGQSEDVVDNLDFLITNYVLPEVSPDDQE